MEHLPDEPYKLAEGAMTSALLLAELARSAYFRRQLQRAIDFHSKAKSLCALVAEDLVGCPSSYRTADLESTLGMISDILAHLDGLTGSGREIQRG